jgi:hypothetical protein
MSRTEPPRSHNRSTLILKSKVIPLRLPYYEDPRAMPRKNLIIELKARQLNFEGKMPVLSARLLKAIMEENLVKSIEPLDMDDRQPEKWLHIANLSFRLACNIEENPEARVECMTRCNEWIQTNIADCSQLTEVAKGQLHPDEESPLFLSLLKFAACLMIQPLVEQEAAAVFNIPSRALRGSAFISQLCTGFAEMPQHLTEEHALLDEKLEKEAKQKGKKRLRIEDDFKTTEVQLNQELSVEIEDGSTRPRHELRPQVKLT